MYIAYIQANKRKITCEVDITLDRAIDFLKETKDGVIYLDDVKQTIEELEYVKSLGSLPGIGENNLPSGGRSLYEDTGGELFGTTSDNTESSSERDNQWD